jgi:hypothetical protein
MQTPPEALIPLMPHLVRGWTYWEPACGEGYLVDELLKAGFKVKWSDIQRDPKEDFLIWTPRHFDCIVTNPPYDIKDKFIARCYELKKPWAMLMPLTALEGKFRQSMYKKYGREMIFMNKRINFITPNGGTSSWFATAWFTWGLNIGMEMTWYEL